MKLASILPRIASLAREHLAEPWDKVGLQVGDPAQNVRNVMLCIDLTEPVLDEAIAAKCQLVIAYHPPLFEPLTSLTTASWKERVIRKAVQRGIAIYSPHTALDADADGINDWLVKGLGAATSVPMRCSDTTPGAAMKIVTFVPPEHADRVRHAMAHAGAGRIGHYSHCSFSSLGEGTFRGDETTHPAVGSPGRLERVPEVRLEMLCHPQSADLHDVLRALVQAHPYEEPAIDVIPSDSGKRLIEPPAPAVGAGRVGYLASPITLQTLAARVKKRLRVRSVDIATPPPGVRWMAPRGRISQFAVCAGAGGPLLKDCGPFPAFITGEMRHHDILDATQRGITVILAGHTQTERPYLPVYRTRLAALQLPGITWRVSRADTPVSHIA